jgi:outer membrane lipoprotein-sorting protein
MTGMRKLLFSICLGFASACACAAPTATELVISADNILWGKTLQSEMEMIITTPTWTKTIAIKMWMDRPTKSFARIVGPVQEAGITSLRINSEMWNYIPNIERTIKIPPSLMLQPWFGSDFTNDDMVKEASYVTDYNHKIIGETSIDGQDVYEVEGLPKANAPVVWGKVIFTIRKADFIPVKNAFYDERGELIRIMRFSDIRTIGGHTIPTSWNIQPANKPGKHTTLRIKSGMYDKPINPEIFSLRNLTQKD